MEVKQGSKTPEFSSFIDATMLEAAKLVVCLNPQLSIVMLRPYLHRKGINFTKDPIFLPRQDFLIGEKVQTALAELEKDWDLALDSRVEDKDGNVLHFPMMDFHPIETPENTRILVEGLKTEIAPEFGGGFLFKSGKSYLFLGRRLLVSDEWGEFLNRFLWMDLGATDGDRIASHKYIGKCRIQRHGCLRLTANGVKKFVPTVIAEI